MTGPGIAVVVSGFPRTSETFALPELAALAERGMLARIFATKPGDGRDPQPGCRQLMPFVELLSPGTAEEQGDAIAARLRGRQVSGIHAYFAHHPADVAACAASRLEVPFGFSVHARDLRKVDSGTFAVRAARAACILACNHDVARDLHAAGAPARLVPHGVDRRRFRPTEPTARPDRPLRLLAVGRLVEKKGFDRLLCALVATCDQATLRIIGDGPERERLGRIVELLRLDERVTFAGACTHRELPLEYASADAVVVPSVIDGSGDRDGLPNVVLEAMASARPVIATRVGAIDSAVQHGATGLLVAPNSVAALCDAIDQLAARPERRRAMGRSAAERVAREFDLARCVRRFTEAVETAYA
jgi:glycosyltransferase involved in cell wall biosynthesis